MDRFKRGRQKVLGKVQNGGGWSPFSASGCSWLPPQWSAAVLLAITIRSLKTGKRDWKQTDLSCYTEKDTSKWYKNRTRTSNKHAPYKFR